MKKFLILAVILLSAATASAQLHCSKTNCSYFTIWNNQNQYPELFKLTLDTEAGTLQIDPLSERFKGLVFISVHDSLYCGNTPLCELELEAPYMGTIQLPGELVDCIEGADPLYLYLCWRERINYESIQILKF